MKYINKRLTCLLVSLSMLGGCASDAGVTVLPENDPKSEPVKTLVIDPCFLFGPVVFLLERKIRKPATATTAMTTK